MGFKLCLSDYVLFVICLLAILCFLFWNSCLCLSSVFYGVVHLYNLDVLIICWILMFIWLFADITCPKLVACLSFSLGIIWWKNILHFSVISSFYFCIFVCFFKKSSSVSGGIKIFSYSFAFYIVFFYCGYEIAFQCYWVVVVFAFFLYGWHLFNIIRNVCPFPVYNTHSVLTIRTYIDVFLAFLICS